MILASSRYSYDDKPETIQAQKQIEFESYPPCPGVWRGSWKGKQASGILGSPYNSQAGIKRLRCV